APAQKPRPAPVTTTTRTSSSASARSKASISSLHIVCVHAFSRSGRLSVIVKIPSLTSVAICSGTQSPFAWLLVVRLEADERRDSVEEVGQDARRRAPDQMIADDVGVRAYRQSAADQPAPGVAVQEVGKREFDHLGDLAGAERPRHSGFDHPDERIHGVAGGDRWRGLKRSEDLHSIRGQTDLLLGFAQ